MPAPRFYRRRRFAVPVILVLLIVLFITYRTLRPTSYERYERIKLGDSFSEVLRSIGRPIDSHDTTNGTDYLFSLKGRPDYPTMMGVPFLVHRIVRVRGGRVVSKGAYEEYYNPYAPGWAPKQEEDTK
jgi:hypothetical protein